MNYGKKSTSKKRNSLISRSSMMGKRARVSFIRVLFVSLIAICIGVACLGIGSFKGVIDNAPDVNDIDTCLWATLRFFMMMKETRSVSWQHPTQTDCPLP